METELIAALIAAFASLAISIFTFFTTKKSQLIIKTIEDKFKRIELKRTEAVSVGKELMSASSVLLTKLEALQQHFKLTGTFEIKPEVLITYYSPIAKESQKISNLIHSSAIFLDDSIRNKISLTIAPILKGGVDFKTDWDNVVQQYRKNHDELAQLFRNEYLNTE